MNPERWKQVHQLFEAALERASSERAVFVTEACGEDESLRQELESLLASHDEALNFMEQPAIGEVAEMVIAERSKKLTKGQTVGHYKVISELGVGGQGAVYKALDTKLNRTVALKTIPPELTVDEANRKRFQREAQLASSLDHPNICTVHDLTEIDGTHFIVMQFVAGHNVRQLVNGRPLELKSALKIAIQICDALAVAHAQGIIHRDIKAHNIIITENGQAKILDFGLAKLTRERTNGKEQTELTALGLPYGTPTYAAPEQSRGERVDHRADIFSTGVLLYEMLAGTWPFQGETAIDVRYAVLRDMPKPIVEIRGEAIPEKLQKIVNRALAKEPAERYQQIVEMRDELIAVLLETTESNTSETASFLENFKSIAPHHIGNWTSRVKLLTAVITILLLATASFLVYRFTHTNSQQANVQQTSVQTIAVLPFKPLSASGDEYLELGMADALITRLTNVKQVVVRPTSAVLKYTKTEDPVVAGRELDVDAVLDGCIQREGDKLRVTVQLIRINDGVVLWSDKFDEDFKSIFAVQDSISERLVGELAMKLSTEERQLIIKRNTENAAAYQAYLKGRYHWNKWSGQGLDKAIENFEQALKEDPSYAPAYAGLADSYELQGYLNIKPPKEAYQKAETAVLKALALDDQLGEAHLVLSKIKLFYHWDLKGAEQEIQRALALNPNHSDAHGFYGTYLLVVGELDKALAERKKMQELAPVTAFATVNVAWAYFYKHDYASAIEQYQKALELDPHFALAQEGLGNAYLYKGMYPEAVEAYLKEKAIHGAPPETIAALKQAYETAGIKGYWRKELEQAQERVKQGRGSPRKMARIYTELGDKDQAFAWLERALAERNSLLIFLKTDPLFDKLRDDPRYQDLMRRVGLVN